VKHKDSCMAEHPLTLADINDYLKTVDDFEFELEVLRMCRAASFEVAHSGTYEDPTTNKPRQFDIRAHVLSHWRAIRMAIECKSLRPNRPMLVSRLPRVGNEQQHDVVYSRYKGPHQASTFRVRPAASMYRKGEMVGKSVKQPMKDGSGKWQDKDSEIYDRWAQAFASCLDLVRDAGKTATENNPDVHTLVLPILVVRDETLWAVDYNYHGVVQEGPRPISHTEIYVGKENRTDFGLYDSGGRYMLSHLHVFTQTGFRDWSTAIGTMLDLDRYVPLNTSHQIEGEKLSQ